MTITREKYLSLVEKAREETEALIKKGYSESEVRYRMAYGGVGLPRVYIRAQKEGVEEVLKKRFPPKPRKKARG